MVERKKSEPVHTGPLTEAQKRQLAGYVDRYERLEDEISVLKLDQKDLWAEAMGLGFDPQAIRELVRRRKMDPEHRQQFELFQDTVTTYELALISQRTKVDRPFAPPLKEPVDLEKAKRLVGFHEQMTGLAFENAGKAKN